MGSSLPESERSITKLTDIDDDALAHCGNYLWCRDLVHSAMSSKDFNRAICERWDAIVNNRIAQLKLKFKDPFSLRLHSDIGFEHVLLDCENLFLSQGKTIKTMKTRNLEGGFNKPSFTNLIGHDAEITCMRSFPLSESSFDIPSESQRDNNNTLLITSSRDNTIRLWWKGSCQRSFPGYEVTTLSEKLLGSDGNVLASGDEDGTVRLWSLSASRKRRRQSLMASLYGHPRPIKFVSVVGHDQRTRIASIDDESEIRVWDADSCFCVGETRASSVLGADVVSMKSHESLLYVAVASSPLKAIDLRTMRQVMTVTAPRVNSFAMLPEQSLLCTGGEDGKAMLWDTRRSSQPVAEMVGHNGSITQLHMDRYKIVTGGLEDENVNVWDTDTGAKFNSFECCNNQVHQLGKTCLAMSVQGFKIVTCGGFGDVCFRNFSSATLPVDSDLI